MSTPLSNTSPSGPALIARAAVPRHGAGAGQEVDARAATLCAATPMELVEAERQGVQGIYLKDLSRRLAVPTSRLYAILGVPKATAEKKAASGEEDEEDAGDTDAVPVNLLIAKQRNGPTGDVHLTFLRSFTRFESASKIPEDVM